MPPKVVNQTASLWFIAGEDDFAVKQRARQVYTQWCEEAGGFDHEMIDGTASNTGEAIKALAKLTEALQTLPFFGGAKVIWLKDVNFLGDERAASSVAVTEALAALADQLKKFDWDKVRLLISAGKVDRRKSFYKALDKLGKVELHEGWSLDDKDWAEQASQVAERQIEALGKSISDSALVNLIQRVGPNNRQLSSEIEKLALYMGERRAIEVADVEAIISRNKLSRGFALGEALGERRLGQTLKVLDEELWAMKGDSQKNEIALLYGLISKVRTLILLKEMIRAGWIKADTSPFDLKRKLETVPSEALPADPKYNPAKMNHFALGYSLKHVNNYGLGELVRAMELFLECNLKMISSGLDVGMLLQQTLIQIIQKEEAAKAA
ncbi:MAG: DNA polymerase III subunit delta [Verrucomicrobiota bacterium]|nr:DNA polymerase III subunit delta [Verrucomicrobiota bacterium]